MRTLLRRVSLLLLVSASALLAGCGAMLAQNPSGDAKPVNAVADGTAEHLMLFGHDVVSYFTQGRHQMGVNLYQSVHRGVTYRFATAEHKALFDKEPARYVPQFGGFCANGIVYGIPWGGDADSWRIIDGKLYIFGGAGSRDGFLLDVPGNLKLAEQYWRDEVAGNNSFWQRSKRLVWRVPHYKSGEELARMVAAAKAKGS
jgi:diadenosine tetraphosphatase ApaH/serine/threonine PP2A family protein phosphatase